MEMNSTNLKNWFKTLGFNTDGKIDDSVLNKLIPPQRRDMWRHIVNHVLPEKDVDLIKKSIVLHKLHERQKPLMAKVESEDDLAYALKYEKLKENYKRIQKNIADVKAKNNKIKTNFNEQNECRKNLIKNIEFKQNSMYIIKHKIDFYSKLTDILRERSDVCKHFSIEANRSLTKTDYEDSLIKCLFEIDQAKQSGVMNDGLNIGQKLCNDIYKSIKDKSPKIYIQTIEENISNHLNKCNKVITEEIKTTNSDNNQEIDFNKLSELFQKQLELKSKLSSLVTKKDSVIKQLKNTVTKEKQEIMSQYQLKYISNTNQELLLAFENNLNESILNVITNSINNSNIISFQDAVILDKDTFKTLDSILEKTNILNEEIDQKKNVVFEMLKEFNDKNKDFGLSLVKPAIDQSIGNYFEKNICNQINEKILCLKDCISSVEDELINIVNKTKNSSTPKSIVLNFRTLQDIKHYSEMIDVISTSNIKFQQLYKTLSEEKNFDDIAQKENRHKSEFISLMDQMETDIVDLGCTIEDCKLVSDVLSSMPLKDLLSFNNS